MNRVAFLVDGAFFFQKIRQFGSFFVAGPEIRKYCLRHVEDNETLYRIFYYDAPPLTMHGVNPRGTRIDFSSTPAAKNMNSLLQTIRKTPQMALRLGRTSWHHGWTLTDSAIADLKSEKPFAELTDGDFKPSIQQKAVDMKIGLDIATLAYKKLVDRVVLIAGDSDFVPAAKLARREGLIVTLDPLGHKINPELEEHVDRVHCCLNPEDTSDVKAERKGFFIASSKD